MKTTHPRRRATLSTCLALLAAAPAAMATAAPSAGATTVYRCGQTYQQVPCQNGQAVTVDDARDPAQRQAAQQSAAADRHAADALAAERAKREQGLQPVGRSTAAKRPAASATPTTSALQKHPRDKPGKHPKTLEATDKTLYAARNGKKPDNEAKLPAP